MLKEKYNSEQNIWTSNDLHIDEGKILNKAEKYFDNSLALQKLVFKEELEHEE